MDPVSDWINTFVLSFLCRSFTFTHQQTGTGKTCISLVQFVINRNACYAKSWWTRQFVDEWSLRFAIRDFCISTHRLSWRQRRSERNISSRISNFLGSISYPICIIHYPFIYLYMVWEDKNDPTTWASIVAGIVVLTSAISLAYLCEKFYDIPMSKWLTKRFMNNASK